MIGTRSKGNIVRWANRHMNIKTAATGCDQPMTAVLELVHKNKRMAGDATMEYLNT